MPGSGTGWAQLMPDSTPVAVNEVISFPPTVTLSIPPQVIVLRKLTADVLLPNEVADDVIACAIALTRNCDGVPMMNGKSRTSVLFTSSGEEGACMKKDGW